MRYCCFSWERLVEAGKGQLRAYGQSYSDIGCAVYLRCGWCFGRVSVVSGDSAHADSELRFVGLKRTWWGAWQRFCDWQIPREPVDLAEGLRAFLRRRVRVRDLKLALRLFRYGHPITRAEYAVALLLGG